MNLTEPLRSGARDAPAAIAYVRRDGSRLDYRALDRAVDHAAHRLLRGGIVAGDIAIVAVESHLRVLILQIALARIGAAAASQGLSAEHATAFVVEDASIYAERARRIPVDDGWFDPAEAEHATPVPMHPGRDAIAIVIQSSGTTGAVKNIALSHRMFLARHAAQASRLPLPADLRQICMRRPSSSYGFSTRMRTLAAGGTIVHATTGREVIDMTARHRVTRLSAPPYWIERLAAALPTRSPALASLEQVEVGGSFVSEALFRQARERVCATMYTNYGVTEAGFLAGGLLSSLDREHGEVGRLADGVEAEVVDAQGRAVATGEPGTLRVRTAQQASGYVDAPEDARATFRDGWIMTGDAARLDADGRLFLGGRDSENLDVGGYKIHLRPIEEALLRVDAIVDVATFGVPGPHGVSVLGAAIVTRGEVDPRVLEDVMKRHSPAIAPAFLMRVPAIPRNEAGKVLRRELVACAVAAGLPESTR